jgi:hypothetical protein
MRTETTMAGQVGLCCPIAVRRAPEAERRRAHHNAIVWAADVGLVEDDVQLAWYSRWNAAEFTARVYGRCGPDDFDLATQWFGWMNVLDDRLESTPLEDLPAQLDPLTAVFRGTADRGPRTSLSRALANLWERTRELMSPAWRARMAYLWSQCADGFGWEARNRLSGRPPSLDDYMARRVEAGGAQFCLALTEALYRDELNDDLYYSAPLKTLRDCACEHICWANDVLTLDRESSRGDVHNLVLVLEAARGMSRSAAIDRAIAMANDRARTVLALTQTVIPDYAGAADLSPMRRDQLSRSVDAIGQWLAGSLEFHRISTRHVDHRAEGVNPFTRSEPLRGE